MSYDVIVIGGGHNGLVCAASLAKRGRKVVLLEARPSLGGLASSWEFHPGFHSGGVLHDTTTLRPTVIDSLNLQGYGLQVARTRPGYLALGHEGGARLWIDGDREAAKKGIAAVSQRDAEAFGRYSAYLDSVRAVLQAFLNRPPLELVDVDNLGLWELVSRGLGLRRLGRKEMMELLRLPPMCVADWLHEWFETDLLKGALALPAVFGTNMGPRSPGSNANLLMWEAVAGGNVIGGPAALTAALEKSARAFGVDIRCGVTVEEILADPHVQGVRLRGGEELRAPRVAASNHPKQVFLELLHPRALSFQFEQYATNLRSVGATGHVLLAVDGPVVFEGAPSEKPVEFARVTGGLDDLERAHDAIKYGAVAERPALDIYVPTVSSPSLAPEGKSVVSVLVSFAPHQRDGGWTDAAKDEVAHRVIAQIAEHVPGFAQRVLGHSFASPVDLEERFLLPGGHLHHGEHSLDQLLIRPLPGCAGYATPIEGLYLCGSGSHPGGGLTGAPGLLGAKAILG